MHWNLFAIIVFNVNLVVRSDIFNSLSDFESTLKNEKRVAKLIKSYIESDPEGLLELKKILNEYTNTINDGLSIGVENPVYFYLLVKNITQIWNHIESFKNDQTSEMFQKISALRKQPNAMPNEDDLRTARVILLRLQYFYNFTNTDLVQGKIKGCAQSPVTLDAKDCFEFGLLYFNSTDYKNATIWLQESVSQLEREKPNLSIEKAQVLKYLAYSLLKERQSKEAFDTLLEYVKSVGHEDSFLEHMIAYSVPPSEGNVKAKTTPPTPSTQPNNQQHYQRFDFYKRLCNGEFAVKNEIKPFAKCFYKKDRPFLRLAPFRVEVLTLKPELYLFHNVISDKEIEAIIKLSIPKLAAARVFSTVTGAVGDIKIDSRHAKTCWLFETEHQMLPVLNRRIADMTNLDVRYSEQLQVVDYGLGGHYEFHYDAFYPFLVEHNINHYGGKPGDVVNDRIATVLFYLSTPGAGGATVFQNAQFSLYPTKNDAIVWFNLLKNGNVDPMTMHAGCPVLSGKKWIANKWIRERGQEFFRKCSQDRND